LESNGGRMKIEYCDVCDKEVGDDNCIEQTFLNRKTFEFYTGLICLECWGENETKEKK